LDERPFLAQVLDHLVGGLAHDDLGGVDPDVGKAGGLRGGVDAGAVGQLAPFTSSLPISSRALWRSAANGEIIETSTMSPASAISEATSATRRMFSTRSASLNPRFLAQVAADNRLLAG
jgi:hypothetical protein